MSYSRRKGSLLEGEKVVKEWVTKEWSSIIATQYRIILKNDSFFNKKTIEIPYEHISSMEYGKNRPIQRLYATAIPSILVIIILYLQNTLLSYRGVPALYQSTSSTLLTLFGLLAVGLFAWFLYGKDNFTIYAAGREPVNVSKELNDLYSIARESHYYSQLSEAKPRVLA